ncbi:MAG: hypothetical protein ACFFG0_52745, partial [Candidatus Thorarchaeota archaeon]
MNVKVNSESLFDENSIEIFVTDVEQAAVKADPVVEVNGMKIWIDPLDAVPYHLDHDMTLNDFLDLIGIRNIPSKQAIYTNPLTGATYILKLYDGNMPLVDVLDLIGYDRDNLELQFLGNAHRLQVIDTTTILELQDDTTALFHPDVREEIFFRHDITDYQRSYFSKKLTDAFDMVKLRIQDTFRETVYESAYNIIKAKYSDDFGITQEEWLELVDSKAIDEHGAFMQEFEKIVDLCLKEQVFLNLIELSGAQDQDVDAIFSTLDTYLDENFGTLIEQLFNPITFEAFIDEVINQVLINVDNEGFVSLNVPTQEYFEEIIVAEPMRLMNDGGIPVINPHFNYKNPNSIQLLKEAGKFKNNIFALNSYLSNDKTTELRILNKDFKILNSYIDPDSGEAQLGMGKYDVQFYFDKIIIKESKAQPYYDALEEYGFCYKSEGQPRKIASLGINPELTVKQRFKKILNMLQSITKNDLNPAYSDLSFSKFDKLLSDSKEILINRLKKALFVGDTNKFLPDPNNPLDFDMSDDTNFNTQGDLSLAQKIAQTCIKIFGRETFQKMLTGSLFYTESSNTGRLV